MKGRYLALATVIVTFAGLHQAVAGADSAHAVTQEPAARADAQDMDITGVWHGEHNGLPWITVTLTKESGTLSGAVLFYLHRQQPGSAETASPGVPEPMLDPRFDGRTLTFEVSGRHAPPHSLDAPPIPMTIELVDADHVRLVNRQDPHLTGVLTRTWH